jgi:hypothetical protein
MSELAIVAIITGLTGLAVAIFSHLKHSECCAGFCKLETRTPHHGTPVVSPNVSPNVSPMGSPVQEKKVIISHESKV